MMMMVSMILMTLFLLRWWWWRRIISFVVVVVVRLVLPILMLCLVRLLLLLLHLDLLLSELCNPVLDNAQVPHDIVLAGCQLVSVLEARLSLEQATTLHVHYA